MNYTWGSPGYANTTTQFPVIIRREHLADIRQVILVQNPEFSYFDESFLAMIQRNIPFSQFWIIMWEYVWRSRWYFEAATSENRYRGQL
jgi:hypothetical protein